jgi:sterol desaturase/sphingolipid hydroxylase (fatty acid hydroxylase superfamily)
MIRTVARVSALVPNLFDPAGYPFWLLVVSVFVAALERLWPWRSEQRALRAQFGQDLLWLVFNGHTAGVLLGLAGAHLFAWAAVLDARVAALQVLAQVSLPLQFALAFVAKDFLEWCVHNLLHRVSWLWELHKVHHSIEQLDWIGSFRFHWAEIAVYRAFTYLPLAALGADPRVLLAIAVVATLIGHLNHANLRVTWGPLRYVLNSPRMHVWHHAREFPAARKHGANFGISLSLWDWLFGTAWWPSVGESPRQQPPELGFADMRRFPRSWLDRATHPLSRLWRRAAR